MVDALVIHVDDVGMCHGANAAFVELSHLGAVTSGSVMVPCPWFPEIASLAAADQRLDLGVHLTLNAEKQAYRWSTVSGLGQSSGLVDDDGYMWRDVTSVRTHANPDAVEIEWRAQIDRAIEAGIDVTHLDAHMGSSMAPEFCAIYLRLAVEYRLPALITATLGDYAPHGHLAGVTDADFAPFVQVARTHGLPIVDRVIETNFGRPNGTPADYQAAITAATARQADALGETESGQSNGQEQLVFCAFHPNAPGPGEIEIIEPETHHVRIDEYELFKTVAWKTWLDAQPFELTGMRELRDQYRATAAA